jgi:hypothetical protein
VQSREILRMFVTAACCRCILRSSASSRVEPLLCIYCWLFSLVQQIRWLRVAELLSLLLLPLLLLLLRHDIDLTRSKGIPLFRRA